MRSAVDGREIAKFNQVFRLGSPCAPAETAQWTLAEGAYGQCSLAMPERLGETLLTIRVVSPTFSYLTLDACFNRDTVLGRPNFQQKFGICYCSKGNSMLLLNEKKRELNPGSLLYFSDLRAVTPDRAEDDFYIQFYAGEKYRLSIFLLQNSEDMPLQYQYPLFHAFERAEKGGVRFPCIARSPEIACIFERCFPDEEQDVKMRNVILTSKLMAISAIMMEKGIGQVQESVRGISTEERGVLEEARQILLRDFSSPPTIGKIAHEVGMNETKLKRDFKQFFGMPIYQYFKKAKMEQAMKLLTSTDLSIREIAFRCGYDSQSQFTAAFRAIYNLAPFDAHKKFGIFAT